MCLAAVVEPDHELEAIEQLSLEGWWDAGEVDHGLGHGLEQCWVATHRLQRVGIQPTAHRTAALLQLAGELPPAILGDLLGLGRTAVQEWSNLAGRPSASYLAERLSDEDSVSRTC